MTALALALPYARSTPLYIPRRDLVLDASDSLSLAVTVTENDAPGAALIDLATGPTFPDLWLTITQDSASTAWDYGGFATQTGSVLFTGLGVASVTFPGTVDFAVPADTMQSLPRRCGWSVRLDHDSGLSETLMSGTLHLRGAIGSATVGGVFTLDDPGLGVLG